MLSKQEILDRITGLLAEKTGGPKPCVVCGQTNWITPDKFMRIPAAKSPSDISQGGGSFPFQPIICGHCGNTHLINLLVLGIKSEDFKSLTYPDETNAKKE
jgi:hypothetical protein